VYATVSEAITDSNPGDTIDVMAGTYTEKVDVSKQLTIQGDPGGARPLITFAGASETTFYVRPEAAGTVVRHFDIHADGTVGSALEGLGMFTASDLGLAAHGGGSAYLGAAGSELGPDVTATNVGTGSVGVTGIGAGTTLHGLTVTSDVTGGVSVQSGATLTDSTVSSPSTALLMLGGATARRDTLDGGQYAIATEGTGTNLVSDSVATSTAASTAPSPAAAVLARAAGAGTNTTRLRNVTAIATGSGANGVEAAAWNGQGNGELIDARNVIARGAGADVAADPADSPCPGGGCFAGAVQISYSNFVTHSGPVVTPPDPHNQSQDPMFVNGTVGPSQDFHLATGTSPVIGAGTSDASSGATDRDGVAHPDPPTIGAYEHARATTTGGDGPGTGGTQGTPRDTVAPLFAAASMTNSVFAVNSKGPPETLVAARKAKKGTTFKYTLSEPGRVVFTIERSQPGRRVGAKCKKPKRSNRKRKKCTLYSVFGRFAQQALAGPNSKSWSGKIGKKKARPGRYRATLTATDAAGNHSLPKRLSFRVVRR
jgi:hypothetical protein